MELLEGIYSRRSVREFENRNVSRDELIEVIRAGTWAPSGLNNQPWRFIIVNDQEKKKELAKQTKYGSVIENAPSCIAVFVDRNAMYHDVKDHQAIGACIQNMLLAAHALGLGAVWLGEILKNALNVQSLLNAPEGHELMAVVALGYPVRKKRRSGRKGPEEVISAEI